MASNINSTVKEDSTNAKKYAEEREIHILANKESTCITGIQAKLEAQLKRARRMNQKDVIRELRTNLEPYIKQWHHVSGFAHPSLLIYNKETPTFPFPLPGD